MSPKLKRCATLKKPTMLSNDDAPCAPAPAPKRALKGKGKGKQKMKSKKQRMSEGWNSDDDSNSDEEYVPKITKKTAMATSRVTRSVAKLYEPPKRASCVVYRVFADESKEVKRGKNRLQLEEYWRPTQKENPTYLPVPPENQKRGRKNEVFWEIDNCFPDEIMEPEITNFEMDINMDMDMHNVTNHEEIQDEIPHSRAPSPMFVSSEISRARSVSLSPSDTEKTVSFSGKAQVELNEQETETGDSRSSEEPKENELVEKQTMDQELNDSYEKNQECIAEIDVSAVQNEFMEPQPMNQELEASLNDFDVRNELVELVELAKLTEPNEHEQNELHPVQEVLGIPVCVDSDTEGSETESAVTRLKGTEPMEQELQGALETSQHLALEHHISSDSHIELNGPDTETEESRSSEEPKESEIEKQQTMDQELESSLNDLDFQNELVELAELAEPKKHEQNELLPVREDLESDTGCADTDTEESEISNDQNELTEFETESAVAGLKETELIEQELQDALKKSCSSDAQIELIKHKEPETDSAETDPTENERMEHQLVDEELNGSHEKSQESTKIAVTDVQNELETEESRSSEVLKGMDLEHELEDALTKSQGAILEHHNISDVQAVLKEHDQNVAQELQDDFEEHQVPKVPVEVPVEESEIQAESAEIDNCKDNELEIGSAETEETRRLEEIKEMVSMEQEGALEKSQEAILEHHNISDVQNEPRNEQIMEVEDSHVLTELKLAIFVYHLVAERESLEPTAMEQDHSEIADIQKTNEASGGKQMGKEQVAELVMEHGTEESRRSEEPTENELMEQRAMDQEHEDTCSDNHELAEPETENLELNSFKEQERTHEELENSIDKSHAMEIEHQNSNVQNEHIMELETSLALTELKLTSSDAQIVAENEHLEPIAMEQNDDEISESQNSFQNEHSDGQQMEEEQLAMMLKEHEMEPSQHHHTDEELLEYDIQKSQAMEIDCSQAEAILNARNRPGDGDGEVMELEASQALTELKLTAHEAHLVAENEHLVPTAMEKNEPLNKLTEMLKEPEMKPVQHQHTDEELENATDKSPAMDIDCSRSEAILNAQNGPEDDDGKVMELEAFHAFAELKLSLPDKIDVTDVRKKVVEQEDALEKSEELEIDCSKVLVAENEHLEPPTMEHNDDEISESQNRFQNEPDDGNQMESEQLTEMLVEHEMESVEHTVNGFMNQELEVALEKSCSKTILKHQVFSDVQVHHNEPETETEESRNFEQPEHNEPGLEKVQRGLEITECANLEEHQVSSSEVQNELVENQFFQNDELMESEDPVSKSQDSEIDCSNGIMEHQSSDEHVMEIVDASEQDQELLIPEQVAVTAPEIVEKALGNGSTNSLEQILDAQSRDPAILSIQNLEQDQAQSPLASSTNSIENVSYKDPETSSDASQVSESMNENVESSLEHLKIIPLPSQPHQNENILTERLNQETSQQIIPTHPKKVDPVEVEEEMKVQVRILLQNGMNNRNFWKNRWELEQQNHQFLQRIRATQKHQMAQDMAAHIPQQVPNLEHSDAHNQQPIRNFYEQEEAPSMNAHIPQPIQDLEHRNHHVLEPIRRLEEHRIPQNVVAQNLQQIRISDQEMERHNPHIPEQIRASNEQIIAPNENAQIPQQILQLLCRSMAQNRQNSNLEPVEHFSMQQNAPNMDAQIPQQIPNLEHFAVHQKAHIPLQVRSLEHQNSQNLQHYRLEPMEHFSKNQDALNLDAHVPEQIPNLEQTFVLNLEQFSAPIQQNFEYQNNESRASPNIIQEPPSPAPTLPSPEQLTSMVRSTMRSSIAPECSASNHFSTKQRVPYKNFEARVARNHEEYAEMYTSGRVHGLKIRQPPKKREPQPRKTPVKRAPPRPRAPRKKMEMVQESQPPPIEVQPIIPLEQFQKLQTPQISPGLPELQSAHFGVLNHFENPSENQAMVPIEQMEKAQTPLILPNLLGPSPPVANLIPPQNPSFFDQNLPEITKEEQFAELQRILQLSFQANQKINSVPPIGFAPALAPPIGFLPEIYLNFPPAINYFNFVIQYLKLNVNQNLNN